MHVNVIQMFCDEIWFVIFEKKNSDAFSQNKI